MEAIVKYTNFNGQTDLIMKYKLKCEISNEEIDDDYTLHHTEGGLLRTVYSSDLVENIHQTGMMKYHDWLPIEGFSEYKVGTITYKANKLGAALGMSALWVTFHGYWPEKGGMCPTGSFKDMEAVPTILRMKEKNCNGLICASAGNTARAFSYFCGLDNVPLVIVVGKEHAHRVYLPVNHPTDAVKLIVVNDGDYYDAKLVSKQIAKKLSGWQLEGGIHNVARRDGIGSLILDAAYNIGKLPTHYFQGIGGGPGPVGVNEMATRLIEAGIFDGPVPRQHVSQNIEHCPIHNAWQAKRPNLIDSDFPDGDVEVFSDYLLNKSPAYEVKGGVYDILCESNGQTYVVTREEAISAKSLFENIEGIDIMTPSAVALASLIQALESGEIDSNECTVLNISGGGVERMKNDIETKPISPWRIISKHDDLSATIDDLHLN